VDTGITEFKVCMEGNFKTQWGGPGYGNGLFNHPHGIAASINSGDIL
jgi:hypothetical protein